MKIALKIILISILSLSLSCNKESDGNEPADYSTLGITKVIINGAECFADNSATLNISSLKNVALTSVTNNTTSGCCEIEYSIISTTQKDLEVTVFSKFSDTQITYTTTSSGSISASFVKITRKGHKEQLTYKFIQKSFAQ